MQSPQMLKMVLKTPVLTLIVISFLLRLFFLGQSDLLAEEAYYWNYAAHLDFGYLDHPPLIAVLIKGSTLLFGMNEFAVRFPALICWGIMTYYSYRWCELIQEGSGQFAVLLLSILPFFFLSSAVMTPDVPLLAAWSAALYYLYRAVVLNQPTMWYRAAVAIGMGCLSKYTIVLVIGTTALYLLASARTRPWFWRKEPYIAAGIILVLFSPVIYWNMTHGWVSFVFQSTRRFQAHAQFSLHETLGLLFLFLTPVGIMSLGQFFKKRVQPPLPALTKGFIQWYALLPLLFFTVISLRIHMKWNWIGPSLLAWIPWFAFSMYHQSKLIRYWLQTGYLAITAYGILFFCISFGQPVFLNHALFSRMFSWEKLSQDFYQIATEEAQRFGKQTLFIPLETYNIASELIFYQAKQAHAHPQLQPYLINSPAAFGLGGLMFDQWNQYDLKDKTIILIGWYPHVFQNTITQPLSPVKMIWTRSQGRGTPVKPIYYQVVKINHLPS